MQGAIAPFCFEEDGDGWVFGVEGHEGAISDHFVGANEFSDHGRPGTRVELMVDSGSTAIVCGFEHFSDTPRDDRTSDATASFEWSAFETLRPKESGALVRQW